MIVRSDRSDSYWTYVIVGTLQGDLGYDETVFFPQLTLNTSELFCDATAPFWSILFCIFSKWNGMFYASGFL